MNRVAILFAFLILSISELKAQEIPFNGTQTVYFDNEYNFVSDKSKATYYCVINIIENKIVNPCKEYYVSGTIHWIGDVISCDPSKGSYVTNGLCTWYDEHGKKQSQATISSNTLNGKFTTWYPNGNLKEEGIYVNGTVDGCDKAYDENENCISATIVVMGKTDYSTIPDEPNYKVDCNCPQISQPTTTNSPITYDSKISSPHHKIVGGPGNAFLSVLLPGLGNMFVNRTHSGRVWGVLTAGTYLFFVGEGVFNGYSVDSSTGKEVNNTGTYLGIAGTILVVDVIYVAVKGSKNKREQMKRFRYAANNPKYNFYMAGIKNSFRLGIVRNF